MRRLWCVRRCSGGLWRCAIGRCQRWRLPPAVGGRWRDDAARGRPWTGPTAHRAAKEASPAHAFGVVAGGDGADKRRFRVPAPWVLSSVGLAWAHKRRSRVSRSVISAVSALWRRARIRRARLVSASTGSPAEPAPQPGALAYQGIRAQRLLVGFVSLSGAVTTTSPSLVHRSGAGPGRRAAHRRHKRVSPPRGALLLLGTTAASPFRAARAAARGVDGVVLTLAAAHLPVRAVHVCDLDVGGGQVPGQGPACVRAGALDPDTHHGTEGPPTTPGRLLIAAGISREHLRAQQPARPRSNAAAAWVCL